MLRQVHAICKEVIIALHICIRLKRLHLPPTAMSVNSEDSQCYCPSLLTTSGMLYVRQQMHVLIVDSDVSFQQFWCSVLASECDNSKCCF